MIALLGIMKKYKKVIARFIFWGIFVIPFLIHTVFKIPAMCEFFSASWNAGDVLAFYGVLLGAGATVAGVFLSIQYAQSNYKEDLLNRSLPFITLTKMLYTPSFNSDDNTAGLEESGYEKPVDTYYYIIDNKEVTVMGKLTERQNEIVRRGGFYNSTIADGVEFTYSAKSLYLPLEVENVGNGAATTFSIGMYIPPYTPEAHPKCFSLARSLRIGEKIRIAIYSENIQQDNTGDYELCVSYYDIFGNKYEQLFVYRIFEDSNKSIGSTLEIRGTQKRLANEK